MLRRLLITDLELIDEAYNLVEQGMLTTLSVEVDDNPPPEGEVLGAKGRTLRRVALLGWSLPALKLLKPLKEAKVKKGSNGRTVLTDVETFYSGVHEDMTGALLEYTPEDVNDIVRNFDLLMKGERPILTPPVGIDHQTAQYIPTEMLSNAKLRLGDVISAKAKDIEIGKGFSAPKFSRVRKFSEKRVVFFSDLRRCYNPKSAKTSKDKRRQASFSEVNMDRAAMLQWLQERGIDTSVITEAIPDSFLKSYVEALQKLEELQGGGELSEEEKKKRAAGNNPPPVPPVPGNAGGIPLPASMTLKFSEQDRLIAEQSRVIADLRTNLAHVQAKQDLTDKNNVAIHRATIKGNVRAFCENQVKEGKMPSSDIECDKDGNPLPHTEFASLMRAAEVPGMHAFSEGGKTVQKTFLEIEMEKVKARKPNSRKFEEKVGNQGAGTEGGDKKAFYDSIREGAKQEKAKDKPPLAKLFGHRPSRTSS